MASNRILAQRFLRSQLIANIANKIHSERLFRRPKHKFWREINAFSTRFYHKWLKIMLIREKCKFLLVFPRNLLQSTPMNVSPYVRFNVKSSSRNGLDIYKLSHKSLGNNSFKSFQLYLCRYRLFLFLSTN